MSRPLSVRIDADAFSHNLRIAKSYAPTSTLMAVVKANAYGHGVQSLIPALHRAEALAVSCLEEAIELRQLGCQQTIMLFEGFFKKDELETIAKMGVHTVLHEPYQLEILQQIKLTRPITVWIKINTGMNRLGFPMESFKAVLGVLEANSNIAKPIHVMSHFSDADDLSTLKTQKQLEFFNSITSDFKGLKSMANSAALLTNSATHFDWVRPGILLYGISPFTDKIGADFKVRPVMTLQSEIIAIHQVQKGDAVGYGSTFTCPETMSVGVVAVGYSDGYPRHAHHGTPVLVNDVIVPLVGRVSMDMITIDLRKCPSAKVGDRVILWGRGLPIEKVAAMADTIAYELVCRIFSRYSFRKIP